MQRYSRQFCVTIVVVALLGAPVLATPPSPIVSSIFVPVEGDIVEPGTANTLDLTGGRVMVKASFGGQTP